MENIKDQEIAIQKRSREAVEQKRAWNEEDDKDLNKTLDVLCEAMSIIGKGKLDYKYIFPLTELKTVSIEFTHIPNKKDFELIRKYLSEFENALNQPIK